MLRTLVVGTALLIAAVACSGSGDSDPTPTPTPTESDSPTSAPIPTPTPTPSPQVEADEYWFVGVVADRRDLRDVDGLLLVTVEVTEHLVGAPLAVGDTVVVNGGGGFGPRCFGTLAEINVGDEIEAFGGPDEFYDVQVCDSERYFVKRINVDPPTSTPTPTPPPRVEADEYWFVGVVREVNRGCAVDAICSVTVEVSKNIGGGGLPVGETVEVIEVFGFFTRRCYGDWSLGAQIGDEVEVLAAREDDERLQICDSERYFVKRINVDHDVGIPTPTPTPSPG